MIKYLKKIGVLSLLFSVAINSNFKAMDYNSKEIHEISIEPGIKFKPIVRRDEHLDECVEIGNFEDIKQLKEWLSTFLPDEAVGRFLHVQRLLLGIGISGNCVQICSSPRFFVPVSEVLDLMVSLFASNEAEEFFESEDKEVVVNLDDVLNFIFPTVKMSKVPALFGKMYKSLEVDRISNKPIFVPRMRINEFFFIKLTFDKLKKDSADKLKKDSAFEKLKKDFTFIVAQIEDQRIIFINYRNICLSNLVRKQEQKVSECKDEDNNINFSYSNKVIEHDDKEFRSFFIDGKLHVFRIKEPFSFENIIVEV